MSHCGSYVDAMSLLTAQAVSFNNPVAVTMVDVQDFK